MNRTSTLAATRRYGTPLYVYDATVIQERCALLRKSFPHVAIHYAMKANSNLHLLSLVRRAGIHVETVSPGELRRAQQAGYRRAHISFTCANLTADELSYAAKHAATVHLDSLGQLETWGKHKLGSHVSLRVNQGIGSGHHAHTITGGPDSKFGITLADLPHARRIAKKYKLTITGLMQHIGSGILSADIFMEGVEGLLSVVDDFPDVTHLDFGGGLGIPYRDQQRAWDLPKLGKRFAATLKAFEQKVGRTFSYALEPGRYIVAESGTLLVSVVDEKRTRAHHFVGVNSGFNHLIRPAMYGSYHRIENLSRPQATAGTVTIAGNVCESGDVFASKRRLPVPKLGDILALRDAGAYGMSMASSYNLRSLPKEILLDGQKIRDISR